MLAKVGAAAAAVAVAAGCGAAPEAGGPPVATVAGRDVTAAEVTAVLDETRRSFARWGRPFPGEGAPYFLDLRDEAVRYLVRREAVHDAARDLGVSVTAADVDAYLAATRTAAHETEEEFWASVRDQALAETRVRADVHDLLLGQRAFARLQEDGVERPLERWRSLVDERAARARYAAEWEPAPERRAPVPPELTTLPEPAAECDLPPGDYDLLEAYRHGCIDDILVPGRDGEPCTEVPPDDFVVAGFGVADDPAWEDAVLAEADTAPSCVPYPVGGIVSLGGATLPFGDGS